jgi:hypothetical protein
MSEHFTVRQEPDDVAKRKLVAITIVSFIAFTGAVVVAAMLLDDARRGRDTGPATPAVAPTTIGTLEQGLALGPPRGLDMRRRQGAQLERWEWVDRDAGIARIPIERAMDLVASGAAGTAADGGASR